MVVCIVVCCVVCCVEFDVLLMVVIVGWCIPGEFGAGFQMQGVFWHLAHQFLWVDADQVNLALDFA